LDYRSIPHRSAGWPTFRSLRTDRWTAWHAVAATVMAVIGIVVTKAAWADIYLIASKDEEYSHIYLVPFVAGWMVWVRRLRFRHCKPVGTGVGVLVAALGWAISSYGFYQGHQSLWHGGSIVVVIGCVLSVLGKHVLFRFFPAVAVLIFMVPVPGMIRQKIAIPLQTWTAQISQIALEIFGVSVERSVNLLRVNGMDVNIVEACNGLRMVFALILVSYAFSFGLPLRNSVRFLVLLASPLAAIFCNVVRILPTIWLYGFQSKRVGDLFHDYSGWLMLPISFLILLGIIKMLRWAMIPVMRYTLAS
jgi:exosortase